MAFNFFFPSMFWLGIEPRVLTLSYISILVYFLFWDTISVNYPGWERTCDVPTSASQNAYVKKDALLPTPHSILFLPMLHDFPKGTLFLFKLISSCFFAVPSLLESISLKWNVPPSHACLSDCPDWVHLTFPMRRDSWPLDSYTVHHWLMPGPTQGYLLGIIMEDIIFNT